MVQKRAALWTALLLAAVTPATLYAEPARHEEINTPHWQWVEKHAGGAVRALFLVNNLAAREPDELAQRFDLRATTVPVSGDAYKNKFDVAALRRELLREHDVIVVAASLIHRDLPEDVLAEVQNHVLRTGGTVREGMAGLDSRGRRT